MIRLNCTNCNALLTIDEAFAGGVCRCQHCGTIQTVPSTAELANPQSTGGKKLFERKMRADGTQGSGLDALAEVLSSSGLSGSGLTSRTSSNKKGYSLPPKNTAMVPMLIAAVVVIILLLCAVIYMATRGPAIETRVEEVPVVQPAPPTPAAQPVATPATPTAAPTPPGTPAAPTPAAKPKRSPKFLGLAISEPSVVYLLDSSSAGQSTFEPMIQCSFRSIESLEPTQKFQILSWHSKVDFVYPPHAILPASPTNINAAENHLKDAYASGPTDVAPSLKKVLTLHPAVICLATGKSLQPNFADIVLTEVGDTNVIIHCFALGQEDTSGALQKIAQQTHGQYRIVTAEDLTMFSQSDQ